MNVFDLRRRLIGDYAAYVRGFIHVRERRLAETVEQSLDEGLLWPEPLVQLNPSFEPGETIDRLVEAGELHRECGRIFRAGKLAEPPGRTLRLHRHQADAVRAAKSGRSYVLTTGTGSGKSLAYIIPIVDQLPGWAQPIQSALPVYALPSRSGHLTLSEHRSSPHPADQ